MSLFNPYTMANINGIPRVEATSVSVSTDAVTFNFQRNAFYNRRFAGGIFFKLPSFTPPTTPVPIVFNTDGEVKNLTTVGGTSVTSAELNLAGVYFAFYDGNTLQLLTGV